MLTEHNLQPYLPHALAGVNLDFLGPGIKGKVRDNYRVDDRRVLVVSDRLSAFDHILGLVPLKGQVLNQLAAFWFQQTQDIIGNHLLDVPDPNVTVAQECTPLPVEVVVRGYITGVTTTALWYQYSLGQRTLYGLNFPDGLRKNQPLPQAIITPTTKAANGGHDERITAREIVEQGLVEEGLWEKVSTAALALFARGQQIARRGGLILVDTKYEFGLTPQGDLVLIDEIHTPDSSRYWRADTYETLLAAGAEPENFDKEFVRLRYAAQGYRGEGEPPPLPDDLALQAAARYIQAYELLTGATFIPAQMPAAARIENNLRRYFALDDFKRG